MFDEDEIHYLVLTDPMHTFSFSTNRYVWMLGPEGEVLTKSSESILTQTVFWKLVSS